MRYRGRVDPDAAVAFARATNDANARYEDGSAVPPLFTASMILPAHGDAIRGAGEAFVIRGSTASVHGEHDVRFLGPVRAGASLEWEGTVFAARQTSGGVVVVQRILVTDAAGVPLVEHLWSNIHVGASIEQGVGPDKPDHRFPEDARARPVGSRRVPIDRDQAFRYAGVSGDHIGHAVDDEIARDEGYEGKILQGLCTLAICSGAVVDVGAGGDPGRVRRFAGRFSSPAYPRRDLVVEVYDAGRTSEGDVVLAFEASQDGTVVVRHGRAELAPG